jgi:phage portal protein BeeE
MLAHGDKAGTYASVEQFMLSFVSQTLQPWLERWEQRLNLSLLSTEDRLGGLYFKFNLKALLRGDAKSRAEFYRLMREMRAITINEIREAEEMNDFDKSIGDNPREDFNGQGGSAAKPGVPVTAGGPDDEDDDDGEDFPTK